MSQSLPRLTTDKKNELIFNAFLDLEMLVQNYRKSVLWLTQGNHQATPRPSVQETRAVMRELKGKMTTLLEEIEAKTQ